MTTTLGPAPDVKLADVKWRVDSEPYERGGKYTARFIPYIDAFIASSLLDEWVGPENWKVEHPDRGAPGKGMWCDISIRHPESGEWVTKTDLGMPSNTEPEKGIVSDSFKRCASLKWGVARNIYRLPNLYAVVDVRENRQGKKVAIPTAKTTEDLLAQLKRLGFADAEGGQATNEDHNEPDDLPQGGAEREPASKGEVSPQGGEADLAPAVDPPAPASPAPADDELAEMVAVISAIQADLPIGKKRNLRAWVVANGMTVRPTDGLIDTDRLTLEQAKQVTAHLATINEPVPA